VGIYRPSYVATIRSHIIIASRNDNYDLQRVACHFPRAEENRESGDLLFPVSFNQCSDLIYYSATLAS
jgi:hypothetical protein